MDGEKVDFNLLFYIPHELTSHSAFLPDNLNFEYYFNRCL